MDAVDFVKNYIRMCAAVNDCEECPCYETDFCTTAVKLRSPERAEEVVRLIEEWAAAHPCKTRQSTFMEQYPEASVDNCGNLMICPKLISTDYRNRYGDCIKRLCPDCRCEFWMQEVE